MFFTQPLRQFQTCIQIFNRQSIQIKEPERQFSRKTNSIYQKKFPLHCVLGVLDKFNQYYITGICLFSGGTVKACLLKL